MDSVVGDLTILFQLYSFYDLELNKICNHELVPIPKLPTLVVSNININALTIL